MSRCRGQRHHLVALIYAFLGDRQTKKFNEVLRHQPGTTRRGPRLAAGCSHVRIGRPCLSTFSRALWTAVDWILSAVLETASSKNNSFSADTYSQQFVYICLDGALSQYLCVSSANEIVTRKMLTTGVLNRKSEETSLCTQGFLNQRSLVHMHTFFLFFEF